VALQDMLGR